MTSKFKNMVDKIQQLNRSLSTAIESVGIVALLIIMVITCSDVIGAKMFLKPVPGALDIVMLAQSVAISFSLAATLIVGGHVSVEIFLLHMKPKTKRVVTIVIESFSLALFVFIVWRLSVYGFELKMQNEGSPTVRIPLYPFSFGIALACLPACVELILRIIKSLLGEAPLSQS
jgi:TRAP-type C4-dicarboxylate transport system permease small subunit